MESLLDNVENCKNYAFCFDLSHCAFDFMKKNIYHTSGSMLLGCPKLRSKNMLFSNTEVFVFKTF